MSTTETLFCRSCGKPLEPGAAFCTECGAKTDSASQPAKTVQTAAPSAPTAPLEENSYFDGGLLQKIGWELLGGFITLITLGICAPWAFCMIYRWEAKHTVINGHRLTFDGTAMQLWGKWLLWMLLTLITLGIYALWIDIKLKKWKTSHTHFCI